MTLIEQLQEHVEAKADLVNQAAIEGDQERRDELLEQADEKEVEIIETLREIVGSSDDERDNHCVFCGMPVEVTNYRYGLSGQQGSVHCEVCGTLYDLRVSVRRETL